MVGGGPCDYCVSPSPFGPDFETLDFGTSDLGLTIFRESKTLHIMYKFVSEGLLPPGDGSRGPIRGQTDAGMEEA